MAMSKNASATTTKKRKQASTLSRGFAKFAGATAKIAGRPYVFILCVGIVLLWAATGPFAAFSDTWQLVINTSTTIVTFLMVFLIQNTQNRDNAAIQAKLDEIIRASDSDNEFIGVEHLSDEELEQVLAEVERYAKRLQSERRTRGSGNSSKPRARAR
jgi:low affinity Fe/Cu permease